MPVFNGEKYLKQALDSILVQTYQDFELIISDNASTDRTQKICLEYAKKDSRIRYYRNKENFGAPRNYNRTFKLSSGEYFKWAAYDDVLAPEYLRKCVSVLDNDPSIVLCHSKTGRIDQNGKLLDYYNEGLLKKIDSPKPHERFRDLLNLYYTTCPIFGVVRTNSFAKTQLHGTYIGADRNLLAEISLMGRIYEIPECLFFWRDHPNSYTSIFYGNNRLDTLERLRKEMKWWSREKWNFFPHWKNCIEYFKSVNRVSLNWEERLLCYAEILGWLAEEGRYFLIKDMILFVFHNSSFARKLLSRLPSSLRANFISLIKK
jgi:glycosyltransferase involved in cell wall biosynthesis